MKKNFDRRQFLKSAGLLFTAAQAPNWLLHLKAPPQEKTGPKEGPKENPRVTKEMARQLQEISEFRKVFRLPGLPKELQPENLKASLQVPSHVEAKPIQNTLPDFMTSYGERVQQLLPLVFGGYSPRLVHGVTLNTDRNSYASFRSDTREVFLNQDSYKQTPIDGGFTDNFFHEVGGHGSDPAIALGLYPLETLISITHGKWKALTQALNIEGQFFKHPGDMMFPFLKNNLATEIAKKFIIDKELTGMMNQNGRTVILEFIQRKASEKGVDIQNFHFTKHVCLAMGQMIVDQILSGAIVLEGETEAFYVNTVEGAFREIYAEMIRYAVLRPEEIQHNQTVLDGVAEVFTSIQRSPVDLKKLREDVFPIPSEILNRFKDECALLGKEEVTVSNNSVMTSEEIERAQQQRERLEKVAGYFTLFTTSATLPEELLSLPQSLQTMMQDYASTATLVYMEYPEIVNGLQVGDMSFDPDMHAWDSANIASAANPSVIYNYLSDPSLIPNSVDDITNKTRILKEFIISPAFGTHDYGGNDGGKG